MAIGTALAIASIGTSLLGSFQRANAIESQTQAQVRQQQAQVQADQYNERVARQNAQIVEGQTRAELEKADRERRLRVGRSIANAGASGIGIESFGDVMSSSAEQEELDLLTIQNEGFLKQREFTTRADLLNSSAASTKSQIPLTKAAGKSSKSAAILSGISGGLSFASKSGMFDASN